MNMTFPRSQLVSVLALVAACDTRADEHYPGDSLLHLEGRVILEDHDGQGLVPALAFDTERGYEIVDVDVQGSFPNNFRIEVYTPPPKAARVSARDNLDVPPGVQLAIAYIAAVPKDHPRELLSAHAFYFNLPPSELAGCATAMPACQRVERWCVDDTQRECRTFGFPCEDGETCEPTVTEGNPHIIDEPSDALAGLSANIVVMWTRDGLPESSIFSHGLGIKQDLKPGYNLVEFVALKPEEESGVDTVELDSDTECSICGFDGVCKSCDTEGTADPDACTDPVCDDPILAEALARYNAAHGTNYAGLDDAYDEVYPPGIHPPGGADMDALIAFEDEFYFIVDQIQLEQGIDISEFDGTSVIEDWHTPLVITISPDVEPLY